MRSKRRKGRYFQVEQKKREHIFPPERQTDSKHKGQEKQKDMSHAAQFKSQLSAQAIDA